MGVSEVAKENPVVRRVLESCPAASFVNTRGTTPLILVPADEFLKVARLAKEGDGLEFNYLVSVTAVDYWDYFEVCYLLHSIHLGNSLELKVHVERDEPVLPSVTGIWRGADIQEREVYDLMGVEFSGHPNLTRVLLWDDFEGHPLRKDFDKQPDDIPIPKNC
jgi:NADH-quinone oxidoreductase subunit C